MTPADFPALLSAAGVSRVWLAQRTGWGLSTIGLWCVPDPRYSPPDELVAWLRKRAEDHPPRKAA